MRRTPSSGHRAELLDATVRFVTAIIDVPGVQSVSLLGSIVTDRPDPKDIDFLVTIDDHCDLTQLARLGRRLKGHTQSLNHGADVFLASTTGQYLGRLCSWRECRPGLRAACDALHCGRRPHLHDDLRTVNISLALVDTPPLEVWPTIHARVSLPPDVSAWVAAFP